MQGIKREKDDTRSYKRFILIGFEFLTSNPNLVTILCCLGCSKISVHFVDPVQYQLTYLLFFSKQLLPHCQMSKLENHIFLVTSE
jgi:hypothetical protein